MVYFGTLNSLGTNQPSAQNRLGEEAWNATWLHMSIEIDHFGRRERSPGQASSELFTH
jgi:hypothetical protein